MELSDPNLKFRNEFKFVCSTNEIQVLKFRLGQVMRQDSHAGEDGSYSISSLYYDDFLDSACLDNDLGVGTRSKFRIRMYNRDPNLLHLEQKIKTNNKCAKRSAALTREQYSLLQDADFSPFFYEPTPPVLRLFAVKGQTGLLSPKAVVEYYRTAFTDDAGNVRITLDTCCTASFQVEEFLTGDMMRLPIQEPDMHVLEVKFDEFLPDYLRQLLQMGSLRQVAFSKYYLSRLILQKNWR